MKTLIITAHPSSKGFTHRIAEAYKAGAESVGVTVEILDLYKESPRQDFFSFENIRDVRVDLIRDSYQAKITESDNIVFIHPLWWGAMPAILKNFIDINISAGFAFRYIKGRPVGLLKGKTANVYITCDGSKWLYRFLGMPFRTTWSVITLFVCGLKVRKIKLLDKKFKKTEDQLVKFLEGVKRDGASLAAGK
ncbi:MAG: NAD(P)H-dependent oxidoreductase [bacterium]